MSYIGPERRKKDRRKRPSVTNGSVLSGRRSRRERRQELLATIVVGLSAEEVDKLTQLWHMYERTRTFNLSTVKA
jgi:hypothetical protein